MVNLTITPEMTEEMIVSACHKATAFPSILIIYAIFGITLFLTGWGFKEKDSSWGRFFWIWGTTMLLIGVFVVFFIFSPGSIQWLVSKWEILWS